MVARARDRGDDGSFALDFEGDEPVELLLERAGRMPLPPYIAARRPADAQDQDDYQTMFAAEKGAVAAPTAALHFTPCCTLLPKRCNSCCCPGLQSTAVQCGAMQHGMVKSLQ